MRLAAIRSRQVVARRFHTADLSTPLASTPATAPAAQVDTGLKHTKTSSGLNVITVDAAAPLSAATVTFRAGSRFEDSGNHGAAGHLAQLIYSGNASGQSNVMITRTLLQETTDRYARAGRETLAYAVEYSRDKDGVTLLGNIAQPACRNWEVKDALPTLEAQAEVSLVDAAHFVAFRGSPIARIPVPAEPATNEKHLASYRDAVMTRGNAVIVATGVEHESFVAAAEKAFTGLPEGKPVEAAASRYVGGESHAEAQNAPTFVLAVQSGGLSSRDYLVASVLQEVFGQTPSRLYSKPRPGDGMSSRLAKRFESEAAVLSAESFVTAYSDCGLFGFEVQAIEGEEGAVASQVAAEFKAVEKISDSELAGAKRRLKRAILAGSETGDLHAHFLARQALFTPKVLDRDAYVAQIDAISVADVKAFVTKAIQAGPTLVSEGSSANYKPVSKLF